MGRFFLIFLILVMIGCKEKENSEKNEKVEPKKKHSDRISTGEIQLNNLIFDGEFSHRSYNWEEANNYCAKKGKRLPTFDEYQKYGMKLWDNGLARRTQDDTYWTSDEKSDDPEMAKQDSGGYTYKDNSLTVICVRQAN